MFLINPIATVIAIVISYGIFFYLERRSLQRTWGDVRNGIWFTLARYALLNLEGKRFHIKNWRPNILVFTGQPHNREQLVSLADWLTRGQGIVTFTQLLIGAVDQFASNNLREAARRRIRTYIQERRMMAFAEVDIVPDFYNGVMTVAQSHGVGGLEPNTVLLGWSRSAEGRPKQVELMHGLSSLGKSVLFLRYDAERGFGERNVIDVWWGGRGGNADLMLLLAHIISQHRTWSQAGIRLLRVIDSEEGRQQTSTHMEETLDNVRVQAEPVVIVREDGQSVQSILTEWSKESDLTLLGMNIPEYLQDEEYSRRIDHLMSQMGSVLLVRSAQYEDILDVDA